MKEQRYGPTDSNIFKVSPELSDLGQNARFEEAMRNTYPNLQFGRGCVVDGAVVIQDMILEANTPYTEEVDARLTEMARGLNDVSNITLQVVDGMEESRRLMRFIDRSVWGTKYPLLVFPGEGAKAVYSYLATINWLYMDVTDSISVPVERKQIEKGVFEVTGFEIIDEDPSPNRDLIIIVDDVIATGQTMQTVAGELRKRYPNTPIYAAGWLFLKPSVDENRNSPSGIGGVDMTFASTALEGNYTTRPAINSLSCFLRNGGKYDDVKNGFIEKYIEDPKAFQERLESIKAARRDKGKKGEVYGKTSTLFM